VEGFDSTVRAINLSFEKLTPTMLMVYNLYLYKFDFRLRFGACLSKR
jgi:hypothetical protein